MAERPDKLTEIEMILKKYIREQNAHNQRMNVFASSQEFTNVKLSEDIDEVKRGLYGDPKNEVLGIIATHKKTELEVKSIKNRQSKYIWWGTGLLAGLNGAIYFVKELIHK